MIVLPLIVGGVLGGAGVYAWARGRATLREDELRRRLAAKPKALPPAGGGGPVPTPLPQDQYRPPDPQAVINVPVDAEDFAQLAEAFCVCYAELKAESGAAPSVGELRDCFLQALYPDFQWPPVPGDPASAHLMWMIADHEARKIVADPSACGPPTVDAAFQAAPEGGG